MRQKSIIAACCMLGLICLLLIGCLTTDDKAKEDIETVTANEASEEDTMVLETQAAQTLSADEERYRMYIDRLDTALADNQSRQQDSSLYRENIRSIYTFSDGIAGWLLAAYDEQGIFMVDWLMECGTEEVVIYQRYRLFLFDDGSQYFTYQTDGQGIDEDIPDYLVNEDTLRHYRLDYVYDDGSDLEAKRKEAEEIWQEGFDRTISGETLEFWYMEGKLYAIDRQEETLTDVSGTKAICVSAFLQLLPDRIAAELNIDETKAAQAEELIPEGYCLLQDSWDNIAACDLNEDGIMDYVMVLCPEETRYEEMDSYASHHPQYYASKLWLFLSDPDEGYLCVPMTDSIDYPRESVLTLTDVNFVGKGILRLEYFVGKSPWYTNVLLFAPCVAQGNEKYFFLLRSYYRDYTAPSGTIQIGDKDNYGEIGIESYYYGSFRYSERTGAHAELSPLRDNNVLDYYSSSRYSCNDTWKEEMINSHIWQREHDILEAAQNSFASEDFKIFTEPVFWNSRIVSQEMELDVWHGTRLEEMGGEEPDLWRVSIPIMLDRDTGEIINVTDFIEKEEFLELFERYAHKGCAIHESLTRTERAQCMAILEEGWEEADSLDSLTAFNWKEISLQITQQGIVAGLRTEGAYRLTEYQIDKEHFMGTELWYYLAPEWMQ